MVTVIPDAWSSFSLKRTVLKIAGRAPTAPMRAFLKPRTTRHTPRNFARSAWNFGSLGRIVCCSVTVNGMPYW